MLSPSIPVRTTLINDMYDAHSIKQTRWERNHYIQAAYNVKLLAANAFYYRE